VTPGPQDLPDLTALPDRPATLVKMDNPEALEKEVNKAHQDHQEMPDQMVTMVPQEHQASQALQEPNPLQFQDRKDQMGHQAQVDSQVQTEKPHNPEAPDLLAPPDPLASQETLEPTDSPEAMEMQEPPDPTLLTAHAHNAPKLLLQANKTLMEAKLQPPLQLQQLLQFLKSQPLKVTVVALLLHAKLLVNKPS